MGSMLALKVGEQPVWVDGQQGVTLPTEACAPNGRFDVKSKLESGLFLSKKGSFFKPLSGEERKRAYLELYGEARRYLEERLWLGLHISHGTLLGAVREGDFIPHDDDFDALYLSRQATLQGVIGEREAVLEVLGDAFKVSKGKTGHIKVKGKGVRLDIMPAWFDGEHLNIASFTSMPVNSGWDDIAFHTLVGAEVTSLACFEDFLIHQYGANWRTPDPTYRSKRKTQKEKFHRENLGEWYLTYKELY